YKPINSERFLHDCHEFVFHFTPKGSTPLRRQAIGVKYQDKSNVGRWRAAADDLRCRGNTWFIPYDTIQSRDKDRPHPATFPSRLPEMCLRLHGVDRIKTVADPFLGLGSTAVACAQLGLNFVGIEMDERYLSEAIARVKGTCSHPRTLAPSHRYFLIDVVVSMRIGYISFDSWICGSSKSSARSRTPVRSRRPATSCTSRSRRSAGRSCCSKRSSAKPSSIASGGASASRRPAKRSSN